jgi:hypothetical protein
MTREPATPVFTADAQGRRIRVGLTSDETLEFERLDAREPLDRHGQPIPWYAQSAAIRRSEDRWFELYRKHEEARLKLERKIEGPPRLRHTQTSASA